MTSARGSSTLATAGSGGECEAACKRVELGALLLKAAPALAGYADAADPLDGLSVRRPMIELVASANMPCRC